MRIAVIDHVKPGDYAEYIYSLIIEKATEHDYQIKTWSHSVPAFQQQVSDNAIIYIAIESNSSFILNWMYKVKILSILKKIKPQVIIDLNGFALGKIKIPQLLAAGQFIFNNDLKKSSSIEKFAIKHFNHSTLFAEKILSYSNQKPDDIAEINKKKWQTIPFTSPAIFKTYEWHEKIMVKAQHADNKEYYISIMEDNAVNDFVFMLQAFSKFKKWQQSNMQLLVLPKYELFNEEIKAKHKTYRYRDDVRLIENVEEKEIAAIMASAYAFVHIMSHQPHLFIISIALQCSLPIISFENNEVKEYAADAVLFYNEKNADALGNAFIQLYKDEQLHAQLKKEAHKQSANLNRQSYENTLWQLIETAAHS